MKHVKRLTEEERYEHLRRSQKEYYYRNTEKINKASKKWHEEHREEHNRKMKEYRSTEEYKKRHREYMKAYNAGKIAEFKKTEQKKAQ
jgi:hypothetical protein